MPEENEKLAPDMPEIPGVPDMPEIPGVPDMPDMSGAPDNEQPDAPLDEPTTDEIEDKVEISPEALLAQDLDVLREINVFHAVLLQMNKGKHGNKEIDEILRRRIGLKTKDFSGPYLLRVAISLLVVLIVSTITWCLIWVLASALGLNLFIRLLSIAMSTFVIAMFGVAIFNPSHAIDEKKLHNAVKGRLRELGITDKSTVKEGKPEADSDDSFMPPPPVEKEEDISHDELFNVTGEDYGDLLDNEIKNPD
jgi:hypothetical protein